MKRLRLSSAAVALFILLGIATGCEHKKPVLVVPQQPPTAAAPQPSPTPEPETAQQPAEQQSQQVQQPATPSADQDKTTAGKKPKQSRRTAQKKPPSTSPAGNDKSEVAHNTVTRKVIPAEKPEPTQQSVTGEISPRPTPVDAAHSQASTEQLLQGAEANLNGITRQLSKDEEAMRAQIREFIKQSRTATTENDLTRAHNWAVKARLLSDELVKQR
ncbi:MAG TPA: hypothetical protein VGJ33_20975 [Candidatus Angelobacter sp.]|jgi:hypothetical protein